MTWTNNYIRAVQYRIYIPKFVPFWLMFVVILFRNHPAEIPTIPIEAGNNLSRLLQYNPQVIT